MKGFKKDGKFRPTETRRKSSISKKDIDFEDSHADNMSRQLESRKLLLAHKETLESDMHECTLCDYQFDKNDPDYEHRIKAHKLGMHSMNRTIYSERDGSPSKPMGNHIYGDSEFVPVSEKRKDETIDIPDDTEVIKPNQRDVIIRAIVDDMLDGVSTFDKEMNGIPIRFYSVNFDSETYHSYGSTPETSFTEAVEEYRKVLLVDVDKKIKSKIRNDEDSITVGNYSVRREDDYFRKYTSEETEKLQKYGYTTGIVDVKKKDIVFENLTTNMKTVIESNARKRS